MMIIAQAQKKITCDPDTCTTIDLLITRALSK